MRIILDGITSQNDLTLCFTFIKQNRCPQTHKECSLNGELLSEFLSVFHITNLCIIFVCIHVVHIIKK